MSDWSFGLSDLIAAIGIAISATIAVLLYILSRKIGLSQSLEHRSNIQTALRKKIHGDENKKVELVNARRFKHDYPDDNDKSLIFGYRYLAGEIKGVYVDGAEFIHEIRHAYQDKANHLSLTKRSSTDKKTTVFVVGVVPYDWIIFINPEGDDTTNCMQIFVRARLFKFPYKKNVFYVIGKIGEGSVYTRVSISQQPVSVKLQLKSN